MKVFPTVAATRAAQTVEAPIESDQRARSSRRPHAAEPHRRRYEVAYLSKGGQIEEINVMAPASPAYEDAFCAIGHSAQVQTQAGMLAVEDVLPGDQIRLIDGSYDKLLWRGTMMLTPAEAEQDQLTHALIRITADALGLQCPTHDLVLGPAARLIQKNHAIRSTTGTGQAFVPAKEFVDGNQFIALRPAKPVNVYQLGFAAHQCIWVNGIGIESLHPGTAFSLGLYGNQLAELMAVFPHKDRLEDFGNLLHPRLQRQDLGLEALF